MITERSVAPILININSAFKNGSVGKLEFNHRFEHHYDVTKDIVRICKGDKVKISDSQLDKLLVAGSVHDLMQRGVHKEESSLVNFLIDNGANAQLATEVINILSEHTQDAKPETLEQRILWAADKANYPSMQRFTAGANAVRNGTQSLEELSERYLSLWVNGSIIIAESPIMEQFPTAMNLFEKRMKKVLDYIGGEGNDVFDTWLQAYKNAVLANN